MQRRRVRNILLCVSSTINSSWSRLHLGRGGRIAPSHTTTLPGGFDFGLMWTCSAYFYSSKAQILGCALLRGPCVSQWVSCYLECKCGRGAMAGKYLNFGCNWDLTKRAQNWAMIIQCQLSKNEYVQRWYASALSTLCALISLCFTYTNTQAESAKVAVLSKYRAMGVLPFFNMSSSHKRVTNWLITEGQE